MDVKPSSGLKVKVKATREAVFGEEGVEVRPISAPPAKVASGVMSGRTLVGFAEIEMTGLDGKKHWYPVDQLTTEDGDKIVEEELAIEIPTEDEGDGEAEVDEEEA
ncbi:MAG: hypothetical protein OK456_00955 [Thaumarchaeota archaeon]|nr:hypothetical protein [Nitrososphaerota archaeon]